MPDIEPYTDEELDELEDINRDGWGMNNQYAARLFATVRNYKAVVERLPKTADGVPVVPGMDLWTLKENGDLFGFVCVCVGRTWVDTPDGAKPGTTLTFNIMSKSDQEYERGVYSTREAAEAALQATNAEGQEDTDAK